MFVWLLVNNVIVTSFPLVHVKYLGFIQSVSVCHYCPKNQKSTTVADSTYLRSVEPTTLLLESSGYSPTILQGTVPFQGDAVLQQFL